MDGDWHSPHYSARHQRFLETLGATSKSYKYDIRLNTETPRITTQLYGLLMVINSQSSTENRSLSIYWLREFIAMTLKQHESLRIQLLSASAAHETQQRSAFAEFGSRVLVTACHPTVSNSLAVIEAADVLLSPDTYAVHAAGAWNIPVISLYEPSGSTMNLWAPTSDSYVQICAPAGKAVSDIGTQDVSGALKKLLTTSQLRERVLLK
jgi:ADP-heptose:LPS heptosyltransferase